MMMMKGWGGDSGGVGVGRNPEQPARPRGSGAGLAWGGGFMASVPERAHNVNSTSSVATINLQSPLVATVDAN